VRRWWIAVMALGASSVVVGIWLMRVIHADYSGCLTGEVCDARLIWPYANLGVGLALLGFLAIVVAAVPAFFTLVFRWSPRWGRAGSIEP
jgi:hypothetical protein